MPARAGFVVALAAFGLTALSACAAQSPPPPGLLAPEPGYGVMPPPPEPVYAPVQTYAPPPPAFAPSLPPGLLPAPPANAGPGECFAKVLVPGQPIPTPPPAPRAVWVYTPGPPGGPPMWCLYFEPGVAPPPTFTPERSGWIRVMCDQQATKAQIRHVQERLSAWGYYQGRFDGRLDRRTLDGVRAFQTRRGIAHGGYLSLETLAALDAAPYRTEARPPVSPPLFQPSYAPPSYPPMAPAAPPVYIPPPPCAPMNCLPQDRGAPPYSRWLSWSGKSSY